MACSCLYKGFLVKSTSDGLQHMVTRVKELANIVKYNMHKINNPGMPDYFKGYNGKRVLDILENKFQVMILYV
jgi:hypothetical protein